MNQRTDMPSRGVSVFVLIAFTGVLTGEYLASIGFPGVLAYTPELSSLFASLLVLILAVRNGFAPVRVGIWIVCLLLVLHLLFGLIANQVQVGTAMVGARIYLRCVPFFLLAIVATPSEKDLLNQFRLLLVIGAIQVPIAVHQKLTTMARDTELVKYLTSGDQTFGTLMNPAILSVFLICMSAVVFSAYLRKKLNLRATVIILGILLFPTTINSTKATIFLIPIALLLPVFFLRSDKRGKQAFAAVATLALFIAAYIPIHDYFIAPRWGYGLIDFFTMEGRVEGYLKKDSEIGTTESVGRIDSLVLPFVAFGDDPVKLTLGLGMGNVSESAFGDAYRGQYQSLYGNLVGPTASRLLWETGLLGLILVVALILLAFDDARKLRSSQGYYGVLALSWLAVVPLMLVGMIYKDIMNHPTIGAVFWYYCGTVVALASTATTAGPHGHRPTQLSHISEGRPISPRR